MSNRNTLPNPTNSACRVALRKFANGRTVLTIEDLQNFVSARWGRWLDRYEERNARGMADGATYLINGVQQVAAELGISIIN